MVSDMGQYNILLGSNRMGIDISFSILEEEVIVFRYGKGYNQRLLLDTLFMQLHVIKKTTPIKIQIIDMEENFQIPKRVAESGVIDSYITKENLTGYMQRVGEDGIPTFVYVNEWDSFEERYSEEATIISQNNPKNRVLMLAIKEDVKETVTDYFSYTQLTSFYMEREYEETNRDKRYLYKIPLTSLRVGDMYVKLKGEIIPTKVSIYKPTDTNKRLTYYLLRNLPNGGLAFTKSNIKFKD